MLISGINFLHKADYKNNQYDYSQWRTPLKFASPCDTFTRTNPASSVSFTAKQERISSDPLTNLYKEHLNCLCCGREMIDPKVISTMDKNGIFKCSGHDAIKILEIYEPNMHTVEQKVFNLLKEASEMEPEKNLKELILQLKQTHEKPLLQKQFGIFKLIDRSALKLKPEIHKEIREYLLKSSEQIKEGNNGFSRKRFIAGLENILANYPNTANKEKLIRLAGKLPTAYDDVDAFIVKYSNEKYKPDSIAIRLLTYSMATIEHIHPKASDNVKGVNHLYNYVPECMRCNSFRSNTPMTYQLEDYPEMFINAQNLFDRLIEFANRGKLSKMYIIKLYKALYQESEGMLDLDYSNLKMTKELEEELKKPFEYPINPDKPITPPVKPPSFPKPLNLFEKPEIEIEDNTPLKKEPSKKNPDIIPVLTKRKRKKLMAEENNTKKPAKPPETKTKKSKSENKDTVKKSGSRR